MIEWHSIHNDTRTKYPCFFCCFFSFVVFLQHNHLRNVHLLFQKQSRNYQRIKYLLSNKNDVIFHVIDQSKDLGVPFWIGNALFKSYFRHNLLVLNLSQFVFLILLLPILWYPKSSKFIRSKRIEFLSKNMFDQLI